ncbi:MAG TPA: ABC transporter permease [Candidatus Bathyarchaeia archaeon]|nr:ABC transporter permease [Candidatus Bathyarchaeia archaeon]
MRRVLLLIPVMLGVTFVTFVLSFITVPNVVRAWAGERATPGALAALSARFHLHDPIYVRYYYYLSNLLSGNWGVVPSSGRPVLSDIRLFFPATLELSLTSLFIAIVMGIPLGVIAAMFHDRKIDHAIRLFYLGSYSSPPFFVALLMIYLFGYLLKIFPTQGELSPSLAFPTRLTGMVIVDSLLTANWAVFFNAIWHIILPATALSLLYFGVITRITRASLLEIFQKDFIRAAFAKGLAKRTVIVKHGLRNALISTVTVLGLLLGSLFGGSVVIETIFQWPGLGLYAEQSILTFDFPSVMGFTVLVTLGVVVANLIADILYGILDPRIKV